MSKVLTIPGGYVFSYDTTNFGGTLFTAPNVHVTGTWSNWTRTDQYAVIDRDRLYDRIIEHGADATEEDPLIVIGSSRGGQLEYKLFRERFPDLLTNVDPDKILFISHANPERKYGGACVNNPEGKRPVYPGVDPSPYTDPEHTGGYGIGYGLPLGGIAPFKMLDIALQYDEWADYPNDYENGDALKAIQDANLHSAYELAPELGHDGMPVNWDDWAVHVEGTVTYLTAPTLLVNPANYEMPWLARVFGGRCERNFYRQIGFDDSRKRGTVEQAYSRPVPVPVPAKYR